MKKTLTIITCIFLLSLTTQAAVKPGENIAMNGDLEADQMDFPSFWTNPNDASVTYKPTDGPGSKGVLIFDNDGSRTARPCVRQLGLSLPAGETFKMSAMVKTANFKCKHDGFIIHNIGWYSEQGIKFPVNTDGWQYFEQTFKLEKSNDGTYGLAIFAIDFTGHAEVAQVKLEAISQGALANSSPSIALTEYIRPRIIPWEPLLHKIPADKPAMQFLATGKTPQGATARFIVDNQAPVTAQIEKIIQLDLKACAVGHHVINVAILDTKGEAIFQRTYKATIVDIPPVDASSHVKMNNFVTVVLIQKPDNWQPFSFDNPKDGWILVQVLSPVPSKGLSVTLDQKDEIITDATPRQEAFRLLPRGKHTLTCKGADAQARIVVKSIAEIFNYPLCANSKIPQNGKYDWDFHEKYVFPAVTTLNGGSCPAERIPQLRQMGRLWLANLNTSHPKDAQWLVNKFTTASGMTMDCYDGFTADEQFFNTPDIAYYANAIWDFPNNPNKLIYTWIVGKPSITGVHSDFMSGSINASGSRGRLIFEAYCHSQPDETAAANYLQGRLKDTIKSFNNYFPNASRSSGILLGNFNQIPVISLDVNPEVDYKYFLDMQLNMLANAPEFHDLATTGYWGSYYDDEELYRWSFKLLRHYCIDGKSSMLSKAYGYKYNPGLLRNCDFIKGLDGWTADAAAKDSVKTLKHNGFGMKAQARWGCSVGTGDNVCVFTRQAGRANKLSQSIQGLVPGRTYTLQFVSADYDDMLKGITNPKKTNLQAVLGEGVTLLEDQSYVFIDNIELNNPKKKGQARVNLHHLRFTATATTSSVTFTDESAKPGERIAFNYIMLKPYFDKE